MKIFVSSTYVDLLKHREQLRVALGKSKLVATGMEDFAAQDRPPLDTSLAGVADCDVYVCLVGTRYGSSPPGHEESFTELEYNHATEQGKYRIVFVSEEEPGEGSGETPERRGRLVAFRNSLTQNHTVDHFSTPADLAWKVLAAIRTRELQVREDAAGNDR